MLISLSLTLAVRCVIFSAAQLDAFVTIAATRMCPGASTHKRFSTSTRPSPNSTFTDPALTTHHEQELDLAEVEMPGLMSCRTEYAGSLKGARIAGTCQLQTSRNFSAIR